MTTMLTHQEHLQRGTTTASFPWLFLLITFGFTWLVCLPGVLAARGLIVLPIPAMLLVASAQFGPSLAAFLLVYKQAGGAAIRRLFKRAWAWQISLRWLLPTLFLPPLLAVGALLLQRIAGGPLPPLTLLALLAQPLAILPTFLFIFLLQGPVPEEFGWRGYLLDRLQCRWNALASSLFLGLVWAVWHLPLFYMDAAQAFLPFWPYLIQVTAASVLITWLYNNTGRNLLVALLFHTMVNLSIALFPPVNLVQGGYTRAFIWLALLYVIAALLVVLYWGAQTLTRRGDATALTT
jgi:uncharacterized protein